MLIDPTRPIHIDLTITHVFLISSDVTSKDSYFGRKCPTKGGNFDFFLPHLNNKIPEERHFHTLEFPCFPWSKVVLLFMLFVAVFVELPNQHLQRCRFIYLWLWCLLGQRLESGWFGDTSQDPGKKQQQDVNRLQETFPPLPQKYFGDEQNGSFGPKVFQWIQQNSGNLKAFTFRIPR